MMILQTALTEVDHLEESSASGWTPRLIDRLGDMASAMPFDEALFEECFQAALAKARARYTRVSVDDRHSGLAAWQQKVVRLHVETNLHRTIRILDMAGLVRLSQSHFARAFRRSFGCTPHSYVVERRLERAMKLMTETSLPLSQLALECGFCDQAHLSRQFREQLGTTPLAWRRDRGAMAEDGYFDEDCPQARDSLEFTAAAF